MASTSLFEEEAPKHRNAEMFDQTRCSRTFAYRICQLVKTEVFEQRVFEHIKMHKMMGGFPLNNLLVGAVRPPDKLCF